MAHGRPFSFGVCAQSLEKLVGCDFRTGKIWSFGGNLYFEIARSLLSSIKKNYAWSSTGGVYSIVGDRESQDLDSTGADNSHCSLLARVFRFRESTPYREPSLTNTLTRQIVFSSIISPPVCSRRLMFLPFVEQAFGVALVAPQAQVMPPPMVSVSFTF